MYLLYTDGATQPSNPGPSGWGAVLISPAGSKTTLSDFLGHGTNQIAELSAALNGLKATPEGAVVTLMSDSQYVIKGLTEWRAGWVKRGWRNAAGEPISNLELWKSLFAEYDKRNVTAKWVRGHNGDPLNEEADALAVSAVVNARDAATVSRPRP